MISSANDITTYSNSFKFIRKWADHENIGYIEAITQFNDSSYIIKNMPIQGQSRYRIINPKSGNLINSYDSIEKANKYISSYTNSFERLEGISSLMAIKAMRYLSVQWIALKFDIE